MAMFMCDILPLSYGEITKFGYRQFFRTLKAAQVLAKAREQQMDKMKNRRRK